MNRKIDTIGQIKNQYDVEVNGDCKVSHAKAPSNTQTLSESLLSSPPNPHSH